MHKIIILRTRHYSQYSKPNCKLDSIANERGFDARRPSYASVRVYDDVKNTQVKGCPRQVLYWQSWGLQRRPPA